MTSMYTKTIEINCRRNEQCAIIVDGAYLGYKEDSPLLEPRAASAEDAHVFQKLDDALDTIQSFSGLHFEIVPFKWEPFNVSQFKNMRISNKKSITQAIEDLEQIRAAPESDIRLREARGERSEAYFRSCALFEAYSVALVHLYAVAQDEES